MLDPGMCLQENLSGEMGRLAWRFFNVLTRADRVIPLLTIWVALPWFIKSIRRKRLMSGVGVGLLALYLVIISPMALAVGSRLLTVPLPSDQGEKVDAIVILGRGPAFRPQRVQVAAKLWAEGRSPLIFASGRGDAIELGEMLQAAGVPGTAIDGEPCSRTTEENAQFTAALLQPRGVKNIVLVTDPPHLLRSSLTFQSLGFEVTPHASPMPPYLVGKRKAFLVFREYLGLASYGLLGRFLPRESTDTVATAPQQTVPAVSEESPPPFDQLNQG